ncbi:tripartite tricarboxylate transporter TctB family protein [Rhodoplanes sp. Z2-YC6860]|uniref:tripartite tricarboxylate transporter TctB family protein n=1 Tax=Rhodoplanes sp. Z2-YC6860 TaxID=674703 RepID=UPI00078DD797|nr:tripartite tricarboxylate transporter TctB family protein [Rhodoplanes sp. Z2-YC6860]AMN39764.1 Tripartite tricarboxylate transporter TctB family [Rhodoplanes sp. Z2-YC6860]
MSDVSDAGPFQRRVEIGVAIGTALFGVVVMLGSMQVGINWGVEGPKAGFFPFYVGLVIVIASGINCIRAFSEVRPDWVFASWSQLRAVLSVVIPTAIYVGTLPYLGIYLTSMVLIGGFMKWLGRYSWLMTLAIAIGVPVLTYFTFEKWFLVPLPKGPIEDWLGL